MSEPRMPGAGGQPPGQRDGAGPAGPLAGLLVADFSRILAGPYATMLLGDLGADVIKVESPDGDDTRRWVPPTRDGVATYYLAINRNKRSVALDLREPGDLAAARELARRADILIQNFKPGGLARFGLDYESVRAANPDVIYASISGFGTGGGKDLAGYDLMVQAMSGLMSLTGDADGPPYRSGISVFDVISGLHAAIAILAALHHRSVTGAGQHVEVSLMASALSAMVNQTSAYVAGGVVPFRMGNSHPSVYPYEPLPTADRDLIVAAANDGQFRKLVQVLGVPALADDPRFATNQARTGHREQLRPLLAERLTTRPAAEWFTELNAAGVPCGPINTVDAGVDFAREIGLEPVVTAGEGDAAMPVIRNPVDYSVTPPSYPLPPPAVDEHGDQIRAWLGAPPRKAALPEREAAPASAAYEPASAQSAAPPSHATTRQPGASR
jgi:crotonobetainyl-CoA:carnitine CoA-transferase CaiB-like acyl-CoA transferase